MFRRFVGDELKISGPRYIYITSCHLTFDFHQYPFDPCWSGCQDSLFLKCPSVFCWILHRGGVCQDLASLSRMEREFPFYGFSHSEAEVQNYTSNLLLSPPTISNVDTPQLSGEALISNLLDTGARCAIRIVPTRNTDFSHLRDGFTRAVQARQKIARNAKKMSDEEETKVGDSLQQLKALFPAQSVPKGKALVLLRTPTGLTVEYEVNHLTSSYLPDHS